MLLPITVVLFTIFGIYEGYKQSSENAANRISPQGCRMSWMSPSYVLQKDFNELWTPLARRYSLWLYREIEWDNSAVVSTGQFTFLLRFNMTMLSAFWQSCLVYTRECRFFSSGSFHCLICLSTILLNAWKHSCRF